MFDRHTVSGHMAGAENDPHSSQILPLGAAEARERALAAFLATGEAHRNCAQTMVIYAAARLGCSGEVADVARYLGAGLARQGLLCGLLSGSALALGLRDAQSGQASSAPAELASLVGDFRQEFGHVDCRCLTGCNLDTAEGSDRFSGSARKEKCLAMAKWVIARLDRLFVSVG